MLGLRVREVRRAEVDVDEDRVDERRLPEVAAAELVPLRMHLSNFACVRAAPSRTTSERSASSSADAVEDAPVRSNLRDRRARRPVELALLRFAAPSSPRKVGPGDPPRRGRTRRGRRAIFACLEVRSRQDRVLEDASASRSRGGSMSERSAPQRSWRAGSGPPRAARGGARRRLGRSGSARRSGRYSAGGRSSAVAVPGYSSACRASLDAQVGERRVEVGVATFALRRRASGCRAGARGSQSAESFGGPAATALHLLDLGVVIEAGGAYRCRCRRPSPAPRPCVRWPPRGSRSTARRSPGARSKSGG